MQSQEKIFFKHSDISESISVEYYGCQPLVLQSRKDSAPSCIVDNPTPQSSHLVLPQSVWYFPRGHFLHGIFPLEEYVPGPHKTIKYIQIYLHYANLIFCILTILQCQINSQNAYTLHVYGYVLNFCIQHTNWNIRSCSLLPVCLPLVCWGDTPCTLSVPPYPGRSLDGRAHRYGYFCCNTTQLRNPL